MGVVAAVELSCDGRCASLGAPWLTLGTLLIAPIVMVCADTAALLTTAPPMSAKERGAAQAENNVLDPRLNYICLFYFHSYIFISKTSK